MSSASGARWHGCFAHAWQPDAGFRLAEVRNRAVAITSGDYLVFLTAIVSHEAILLPNIDASPNRAGWSAATV